MIGQVSDPGAVVAALAWSLAAVTALAVGALAALAVWAVESVRRACAARDAAWETADGMTAAWRQARAVAAGYTALSAVLAAKWVRRTEERDDAHRIMRERRAEIGRLRARVNDLEQARDDSDRVAGDLYAANVEVARLRERLAAEMQFSRGGCGKRRLPDETVAWRHASNYAAEFDGRIEHYDVYPCDECPRQPVTLARWWHVKNADPSESTGSLMRGTAPRRRAEIQDKQRSRDAHGSLGDRLLRDDPTLAARLQIILKPDEE